MSALVAAWLALSALLVWVGTIAGPPRIACGDIDLTVCRDTVAAALDRGLTEPHPLILGATVAPGPAWPAGMGHRATVSLDLAGVTGATTVRLFYDIGGHWGGASDRGAAELAAWSVGWAALVSGLTVALLALAAARVRRSGSIRRARAPRAGSGRWVRR